MTVLKRLIAAATLALFAVTANAATVGVENGSGNWIGFMNVSELPANGGGFVFGGGWGVPDLTADFDDANSKVTLGPNSVNDVNEFWYQCNVPGSMAPDCGGPGALGNKQMEANLFLAFANGSPELAALQMDGSLTFEGNVISNTFTQAHVSEIFIKEFSPDFSMVSETAIPLVPGPFTLTQAIVGAGGGLGGEVQYGFRTTGENVWSTDVGPFGNAMIQTPEPAAGLMAVFAGLALATLRRRK